MLNVNALHRFIPFALVSFTYIVFSTSYSIYAGGMQGQGGQIRLMVELTEEPTSVVYSRAKANPAISSVQRTTMVIAQWLRVKNSQQVLIAQLTDPAIGAEILSSTQTVANTITIRVNRDKARLIRQLPGVKKVSVVQIAEIEPTPGDANQ